MSFLGTLWNKHKRKILIALGIVGGGFIVYRLYDAHTKRLRRQERRLEDQQQADELIKTQLQTHFENIQRISDTTTLPYAMHCLRSRIYEELDLSHLTEKLMQGKGQPNSLSPREKLELWEKLKILSFTRTAASLWSMTMLSLYIRVQVNILGRHLYLQFASSPEASQSTDESDSFSKHGQQEFLATADYLPTFGINPLIMNMQTAASQVLKEKQLKDSFNINQLHETIMQMLDLFMNMYPNYWISYLVPEDATTYRQLMAMSNNGFDDSSNLMDVTKLEQLISETREVLSSSDFRNIALISLKKVVDLVIEDMSAQAGGSTPEQEAPLAKLLPRVAQMSLPLLEEPTTNKFLQTIRSLPEVELFYTLLYADIPQDS